MAKTTPLLFLGRTFFNKRTVRIIRSWYKIALGDLDKAGDVQDAVYYQGLVDALESVLSLLHDPKGVR